MFLDDISHNDKSRENNSNVPSRMRTFPASLPDPEKCVSFALTENIGELVVI